MDLAVKTANTGSQGGSIDPLSDKKIIKYHDLYVIITLGDLREFGEPTEIQQLPDHMANKVQPGQYQKYYEALAELDNAGGSGQGRYMSYWGLEDNRKVQRIK